MDSPKNLIYAAIFTIGTSYGADFTPMNIPFLADMYKDARIKAEQMVISGDVSSLAPLTQLASSLEAAQNGNMDAILRLATNQESVMSDMGYFSQETD